MKSTRHRRTAGRPSVWTDYRVGRDHWLISLPDIPDQQLLGGRGKLAGRDRSGIIPIATDDDILWSFGLRLDCLQELEIHFVPKLDVATRCHRADEMTLMTTEQAMSRSLPADLFQFGSGQLFGSQRQAKWIRHWRGFRSFEQRADHTGKTLLHSGRNEGRQHQDGNDRLFGVLNGLDYDVWNPKTDRRITANFSSNQLDGKAACREALLELLGFTPIVGAPLIGMISRISTQKGFDLLVTAAEELFQLPIQMVVQGLGDPQIIDGLKVLEQKYPNQFRMLNAFDEELAQKIYSGCDAFLMPSSFEPCGLGQLIAMRYGTLPIVRATGGLRDTVIEGQNGFVFEHRNRQEFIDAVTCAQQTFGTPEWAKMVSNAMNANHDWSSSAKEYVELYEKAIQRREGHEMICEKPGLCA